MTRELYHMMSSLDRKLDQIHCMQRTYIVEHIGHACMHVVLSFISNDML